MGKVFSWKLVFRKLEIQKSCFLSLEAHVDLICKLMVFEIVFNIMIKTNVAAEPHLVSLSVCNQNTSSPSKAQQALPSKTRHFGHIAQQNLHKHLEILTKVKELMAYRFSSLSFLFGGRLRGKSLRKCSKISYI